MRKKNEDQMMRFTKGNYWGAKACFRVWYRDSKEWDDKIKRMQAIADEKEYQGE
jgi:hypothetical protein